MARRQEFMNDSDFEFEQDDPVFAGPSAPAGTNNDPDISYTPNYFDGSAVVQPVWNPGGGAGVPATGEAVDPETISPGLFSSAPESRTEAPAASTAAVAGSGWTPLPTVGPIPTSGGVQVGSGTPWTPGSSAPSTAPPGYHWDKTYAMFMPNATAPSTAPAYGGGPDQSILALLQGGMSPQEAIALFNQKNGRTTGNEALYYNDSRGVTIGLPSGYAALTPNGWTWTTRTPETGGGGAGGTSTAGGGAAGSGQDFNSLLKSLQSTFGAGPTISTVSPTTTGLPLSPFLNQVGQTPFDDLMNGALGDLLSHGGASPYGRTIEATLNDLIHSGGMMPNTKAQLSSARDASAGAMSGQLADARAALAARGLASPRGASQGAEATAIGRISQNIAPTYAQAVTDINSHAIDVANTSVMQALSMATGLSESDATTILNTVGTGTARQTALANIALKTLEDNMQWNEFLANFGLQKDQIAEQLAQGRINSLVPLLSLFLQMSGQAAGGYLGQNN